MENLQDEEWIYLSPDVNHPRYIAAISNRGRFLRNNGEFGILRKGQPVRQSGVKKPASHVIAENFLITVKRTDQILIDHITHNPKDMHINDVRNLRWCTQKENVNFRESIENRCASSPRGPDHYKWNPLISNRRREYMKQWKSKRRAAKLNAQQP